MIQFAHEDGCPWSSDDFNEYGEYFELMWPTKQSYCPVKLKYLVDNGCEYGHGSTDRVYNVLDACCKLRDLSALECLVGKYSRFDNSLLRELLSNYYSHQEHIPNQDSPWIDGIKYVFEKGKEITDKTIESIFEILPNMDIVKYLRESLKFPWTSNDRNKYIPLSKIAHYPELTE